MRRISTLEHAWLHVGSDITREDADLLSWVAPALPPGAMERGHRKLKFTQFCGVLQVGHLQIEVLPKIHGSSDIRDSQRSLLKMLAVAGEIDLPDAGEAQLSSNASTLLDVFIHHFARELELQLQHGMLLNYVDVEENLDQVRGRIDLLRQQRENLFTPQRIACRFSERSSDIRLNRLIRSALDIVHSMAADPLLQQYVGSLRSRFAAVNPLRQGEPLPEEGNLTRLQRRYSAVIKMARMFVSRRFQDVRSGSAPTFSLLFDMNTLFERYVARVLKQPARALGMRLIEQGPRRYLGTDDRGKGRLLMKPDITLLSHGNDHGATLVAIIDTKWKLLNPSKVLSSVNAADLYQMTAYGYAYDCPSLALVFPEQAGLPASKPRRISVETPTGRHEISLIGFSLIATDYSSTLQAVTDAVGWPIAPPVAVN